MSSILIPATKSLTVTNKLPNGNINGDIITVGSDGVNKYISYLFFDISAIPSNVLVTNAELVLFKTNNFYNDYKKEVSICTLNDYFSTYTTFNNRPSINSTIKRKFHPITSAVAVTVNLTYFLSLWFKNKLTNTGITLFSNDNILANFGSAICKDAYLIPFINVSITPTVSEKCDCFRNCNCNNRKPTIRQVRVIGTVAEDSQYEAIVNIGVTRSGSGHTDNYYVADEYNNLLSGTPLHVDKTYNMAIIPREKPGDVETIDFYGSYKA